MEYTLEILPSVCSHIYVKATVNGETYQFTFHDSDLAEEFSVEKLEEAVKREIRQTREKIINTLPSLKTEMEGKTYTL